jgi:hypothetical protein
MSGEHSNWRLSVKKFALITIGFEAPTPDMMAAWQTWFESIKGSIELKFGLRRGREISAEGAKELPLGLDSITGVMIVRADSLEDAERLAQSNPYISSIRVYELMGF